MVHDETMFAEVTGFGAVYVQDWERTGVPPVQPEGEEVATVRVWVPFDWQAPQVE